MRSILLSVLTAALLPLTGCYGGTRTVAVPSPQAVMASSSGGPAPAAVHSSFRIVEISDDRRFEEKPKDPSTPSVKGKLAKSTPEERAATIGRLRSGMGKALGGVLLPDGRTVQAEMRELVASSLRSRGHTVNSDGSKAVRIQIREFWGWMQPGAWDFHFKARVRARVTIGSGDGAVEMVVAGEGANRGSATSYANWGITYDRAYLQFVENLTRSMAEAGL